MVFKMLEGSDVSEGNFKLITPLKEINNGGAGSIWTLKGHPNFVLKLYHDTVDLSHYEKKIEAMINNKPEIPPIKFKTKIYHQISWPICSVFKNKKFVGYIMPRINQNKYVTLGRFLHRKSRSIDNLPESLQSRFKIAYNLSTIVARIHNQGHMIVDLKPKNCSVHRELLFVSIFDSDGFCIKSIDDMYYPAKQFTPEYIAPEFIKKKPEETNIEQDHFSLAVIIFQLINNGIHPFQAGMKSRQLPINEMIMKKHYAYSSNGSNNLIPNRNSLHEFLPEELTHQFDQAFTYKNRPLAKEWPIILDKIANPSGDFYSKCSTNPKEHFKINKKCPICELDKKKLNLVNYPPKKNTTKKKYTYKDPFSSKVKSTRIKNFQNINFYQINKKVQKRNKKPITKKYIKKHLILICLLCSFITHFGISLYLNLNEINFDHLLNYYYFKSERLLSTSLYLIILFVTYYWSLRGDPNKDCPSCGAFAGSIQYRSKKKDFHSYQYQTKSGKPDRRYSYNPELFSLITRWSCRYCKSKFEFLHELDEFPSKKTPIISVKIK